MEAKDKSYVINTKDLPSGVAPLHYESNSWCPVINDDIEMFITEIRPGGRADLDNHPDSDHIFTIFPVSGIRSATASASISAPAISSSSLAEWIMKCMPRAMKRCVCW